MNFASNIPNGTHLISTQTLSSSSSSHFSSTELISSPRPRPRPQPQLHSPSSPPTTTTTTTSSLALPPTTTPPPRPPTARSSPSSANARQTKHGPFTPKPLTTNSPRAPPSAASSPNSPPSTTTPTPSHEQVEKAKELVHQMVKDAGIPPDVVSYNTLINGCVMVDDSAGALAFFNEMRARGITPTEVSYTTLMKAFAKIGQPKVAHKVFDEMLADPRVKVDQAAWNMLVEGYCKQGLIEEAKNVVRTMREHGFYPSKSTYGSLANGIALARKPGEALLLWNEIKERCKLNKGQENSQDTASPPPFKPDEWLLDALADIFVRAAFFKKALEVVVVWRSMGYHQTRASTVGFTWRCIRGCSRASMPRKPGKTGDGTG